MKKLKEFLTGYADFIGRHRLLLLLLCFLSWMSVIDIPSSPVFGLSRGVQLAYPVIVGIAKGMLLLTLLYPCLKRRELRWLIVAFCFVFALLALMNAISFRYYDMGITRKLILVFAQTTRYEAAGFLPGLLGNLQSSLSTPTFYIALLLFAALIFIVRMIPRRIFGYSVISLAAIGVAAFIGFAARFSSGRSAHLLSARIVKYSREVWQTNKAYEALLQDKKPLPFKESARSERLANSVVVVIGESAHRRHHSLYGYPLPTSPCLMAKADSLVVFTDVIGSAANTSGNMERILSFKEDDLTADDGLKYPLVIDLFNELGYKTFWLSNQERTGSVSNTSGIMTMNADVVRYVGAENSEDALTVKYDEALLPYFRDALNEDNAKLIFLHLLGSHVEYNARYPKAFNHFTADDEKQTFKYKWLNDKNSRRRAEYDNSIRYTDAILGEIIEEVARKEMPALVIYFSDHGEEVYDFGPYTGRNDNTVQVPFIIYANHAYSASNPELMEHLKCAKDKPLSTANLVHTLLTLTGSQYRFYDPTLDVLSADYHIRPRNVDEKPWPYDLK